MELPGRPPGNADAVRAAAIAWDHLAWEIWQLSRALESKADALAQDWSGVAADIYVGQWNQLRRGFYALDEKIHGVARQLCHAADSIEAAQTTYDRALAAAGLATVVGIGLTVFTLGASDAAAAEADGVIAATAATVVAELGATLARVAAFFAESAQALGELASRIAVNFSLRAPDLFSGPIGSGLAGAAITVASGDRDPEDILAGGVFGAAEGAVTVRARGVTLKRVDREASAGSEGLPLYSRTAPRTNAEVVASGEGLPRTQATIRDVADRAGIDLSDVRVTIVEEADYIRYLDCQGACAVTPSELGGGEVHLGPASFADEDTLAATLAHEHTHVLQLRRKGPPTSDSLAEYEAEAYASEAHALRRLLGGPR